VQQDVYAVKSCRIQLPEIVVNGITQNSYWLISITGLWGKNIDDIGRIQGSYGGVLYDQSWIIPVGETIIE
jgi:hypothetical protein